MFNITNYTHLCSACNKYGFEIVKRVKRTFNPAIFPLLEGSFNMQVIKLWLPTEGEPSGIKWDQYENMVLLSVTYKNT